MLLITAIKVIIVAEVTITAIKIGVRNSSNCSSVGGTVDPSFRAI